ncbi:MAG: FecR family protein [Proteobacteria bacterium]|nr:FecR family protein [Pseudomonadota bacterium]
MHDMTPQLEQALSHVGVAWDVPRSEASWRGMRKKRVRRAVARTTAATAATAVVVVCLYAISDGEKRSPNVVQPNPQQSGPNGIERTPERRLEAEPIVIDDSVVATPSENAEVAVVHRSHKRIEVRVVRGKSHFRVKKSKKRTLAVVAGSVRVTVFASEFSVAQNDNKTDVWTHSGSVRVAWRGQTYELIEGEHRRFAASATEPSPGNPDRVDADRADVQRGDSVDGKGTVEEREVKMSVGDGVRRRTGNNVRDELGSRLTGSNWRELANAGDFATAYQALRDHGRTPSRVRDLMLAADVYRMSDHPRDAVAMFTRVIDEFPDDPRAALAAFTLGRVLLDDLGQPQRAARAFAQARTFAPRGPLAEDALAREVEAWSKAGRTDKARDRAGRYLQTYPDGHRIRAVKQYGGL